MHLAACLTGTSIEKQTYHAVSRSWSTLQLKLHPKRTQTPDFMQWRDIQTYRLPREKIPRTLLGVLEITVLGLVYLYSTPTCCTNGLMHSIRLFCIITFCFSFSFLAFHTPTYTYFYYGKHHRRLNFDTLLTSHKMSTTDKTQILISTFYSHFHYI